MARKKYKRYNPYTNSRVKLYDYVGYKKGEKRSYRTQDYSGRMYDVSIESLRNKLKRFHPNHTFIIKLVKTNTQLKRANVGKDWNK